MVVFLPSLALHSLFLRMLLQHHPHSRQKQERLLGSLRVDRMKIRIISRWCKSEGKSHSGIQEERKGISTHGANRLMLPLPVLPTKHLLAAQSRQVESRSCEQGHLGPLVSTLLLQHTRKIPPNIVRQLSGSSKGRVFHLQTSAGSHYTGEQKSALLSATAPKWACDQHLVEGWDTPRKGPGALESKGCCLKARQRISQLVSFDAQLLPSPCQQTYRMSLHSHPLVLETKDPLPSVSNKYVGQVYCATGSVLGTRSLHARWGS